jgi:hypothetical protein
VFIELATEAENVPKLAGVVTASAMRAVTPSSDAA